MVFKFITKVKERVESGFDVNPKLQRTQAKGSARGKVKVATSKGKTVKKGIVRLPNRRVPQKKKRRKLFG